MGRFIRRKLSRADLVQSRMTFGLLTSILLKKHIKNVKHNKEKIPILRNEEIKNKQNFFLKLKIKQDILFQILITLEELLANDSENINLIN